jgi:hypothetical protein
MLEPFQEVRLANTVAIAKRKKTTKQWLVGVQLANRKSEDRADIGHDDAQTLLVPTIGSYTWKTI